MATSIKRSKGSQSSLRIGTFSYWIKIATPPSTSGGFQVYTNTVANDNNRGYWQYTSDGKWRMVDNDDGGTHIQLRTNRLFRDPNGWYHFVVRIDTTQYTSTDRVRLYVNGVQETSFDQTDYPAQNTDLKIFEGGQTDREYMNRIYGGSPQSANWYVSHFHYCDGQSYGPDSFGSTDSTTGEWKINTSPSVNYGNQGWFMFKNDASLNDDSGNGNNWSSDSGTIQKSEDNPSNVFATLNPLQSGSITFSNGNNTQSNSSSTGQNAMTTLGAVAGKFYAEVKCTAVGSNGTNVGFVNLSKSNLMNQSISTGQDNFSAGLYSGPNNGPIYYSSETTFANVGTTSDGDIIQLAMDLDNGYLYWGRNGTWLNSGDPTSAGSGTGGLATSNLGDGHIGFNMWQRNSANASWNFGNGYFGTTAVSSAGTNASGIGIFEYDVPTGYTALSTKGLNE
jgi:hypothetical protein